MLNDNHTLAQLNVKNIYESYKHIALKHTLTELRQRFWIIRGRSFVREVLRKCLVCRRFEGKTYHCPITPILTTLLDLSLPPIFITLDLCMLKMFMDNQIKLIRHGSHYKLAPLAEQLF